MGILRNVYAMGLAISLVTAGCTTGHRVLSGSDLTVDTSLANPLMEVALKQRGVGLFRLVPAVEASQNSPEYRAALFQRKDRLVGLVVEKSPLVRGIYNSGESHFVLPRDFEPSTHCFVVVGAPGYILASSRFGSDDKRLMFGLFPYSRRYPPRLENESTWAVEQADKVFSGTDLECSGTVNDYVSSNNFTSAGW
jgi:hypothetical protein